jgi:hypothetical protein
VWLTWIPCGYVIFYFDFITIAIALPEENLANINSYQLVKTLNRCFREADRIHLGGAIASILLSGWVWLICSDRVSAVGMQSVWVSDRLSDVFGHSLYRKIEKIG